MHTPWGNSQTSKQYGEGLTFYGTASHGGFFVEPELHATMNPALRLDAGGYSGATGWYEEDCEAYLVVRAFPGRFPANEVEEADQAIKNSYLYPHWEKLHGRILQPGESAEKDRDAFHAANRDSLLVVAAWGDWKEGVPKGMVGVVARPGGREYDQAHPGSEKEQDRWFLVPATEYATRRYEFVVDPTKHQAIDPLQ